MQAEETRQRALEALTAAIKGEKKMTRTQKENVSAERIFLQRITKSAFFSFLIYGTIFANTVIIAFDDTWVSRKADASFTRTSEIADWIILGIFTAEMVLKLMAYGVGFKPPRDPEEDPEIMSGYFALDWNRFDCVIVIMSWILVPVSAFSGSDVTRLARIMRLTRPLRALKQIRALKGTQELVTCIPISLPSIFDVMNLLLFCLLVFGILGLNLFGLEGKFHGRCVVTDDTYGTKGFLLQPYPVVCSSDSYTCEKGRSRCSCMPSVFADGSIEQPPYSFTDTVQGDIGCLRQESARPWAAGSITERPTCPNFGFSCFDNFAVAIFTSFSSITLDSWSQTMFWAQDSMSPAALIFFVALVVLVSFNVINLFVASMSNAYREVRGRRVEEEKMVMLEKKRKERMVRRAVMIGEILEPQSLPLLDLIRGGKDEEEDAKRVWYDRLLDPKLWRVDPFRGEEALNSLAHLCRVISTYPRWVDDRGNLVPHVVVKLMEERNVTVRWGPYTGHFRIISLEGGCRALSPGTKIVKKLKARSYKTAFDGDSSDDESDDGEVKALGMAAYRSGQIVAEGADMTMEKEHLKETVMLLEKVHNTQIRVDDVEKAPYLDIFILVCIFINTATACIDHFEGRSAGADGFRADLHCCDSTCSVMSEDRCPRGLLKMQPSWYTFTFNVELIFNIIFTLEMFVRIVSFMGIKNFVRDQFPSNLLDILIVLLSDTFLILDIFLPKIFNAAVFRLLRLVRAIRLATRLRRLRILVNKTVAAANTVVYVLFLLVFFHVLMALTAMQIFRCEPREEAVCKAIIDKTVYLPGTTTLANATKCPEHCTLLMGDPERCVFNDEEIYEHCPWNSYMNFDSFGNAIMLLFYVTTGDNNWTTVLANGMRSLQDPWAGLFFFLLFYGISVYIICNLFICAILEEFELSDDQKEGLQIGQYRVKRIKAILRKQELLEEQKQRYRAEGKKVPEIDFNLGAFLGGDFEAITDEVAEFMEDEAFNGLDDERKNDPVDIFFCLPRPLPDRHLPNAPRNLRWYVHRFVRSRLYTVTILLTILASTAMLAIDTPIDSKNIFFGKPTVIADYVFFSIFTAEFCIKILLHGIFWEHKDAYFRKGWNILDFCILLFQAIDIFSDVDGIKSLRVLRVVRPLRLLNKLKSLQLILAALWSSTADICNILVLWSFAFIAFGVIGMFLFGGKLYKCSDVHFAGPPLNPLEKAGSLVGWRENCVGNELAFSTSSGVAYVAAWSPTAIMKPRVWANPEGFDFDNFANACQALFEVSTLRHWSNYVIACTDAVGFAQQPIENNNRSIFIFFMLWIIISCFFLLQMIIGVLIDSINQQTGSALFTYLQRNWMRTEQNIAELKPLKPINIPKSFIRNYVWMLVHSNAFQNVMTLIILVNVIFMATESYDQPQAYSDVTFALNIVFIALYCTEITLKIIALGVSTFYDPWNIFDQGVVIGSIVDIVLSSNGGSSGLQALRVLRILRVVRALRLVRRNPRLKLILNTMAASVYTIFSIIAFMALYVFLFAKVANQLFGGVRFGKRLSRNNNFETTWEALLAMFVVVTGDEWQAMMRDVGVHGDSCTQWGPTGNAGLFGYSGDPPGSVGMEWLIKNGYQKYFTDPNFGMSDCGDRGGAIVFFDVFFFVGYNVIRSAFIAVIMENFFAFKINGGFLISEANLLGFQLMWRELDPDATGKIKTHQLKTLMQLLADEGNPIGTSILANDFKWQCFRVEMTHNNRKSEYLTFSHVLRVASLRTVGPKALKYDDMIKRIDEQNFYGQIAACEKMVASFRMMKERKSQTARKIGLSTTMAALGENEEEIAAEEKRRIKNMEGGAEAVVRGYRKRVGHAHGVDDVGMIAFDEEELYGKAGKDKTNYKPALAQATVAESSLAKLAGVELNKFITTIEGKVAFHSQEQGDGNGHSLQAQQYGVAHEDSRDDSDTETASSYSHNGTGNFASGANAGGFSDLNGSANGGNLSSHKSPAGKTVPKPYMQVGGKKKGGAFNPGGLIG